MQHHHYIPRNRPGKILWLKALCKVSPHSSIHRYEVRWLDMCATYSVGMNGKTPSLLNSLQFKRLGSLGSYFPQGPKALVFKTYILILDTGKIFEPWETYYGYYGVEYKMEGSLVTFEPCNAPAYSEWMNPSVSWKKAGIISRIPKVSRYVTT